MPDTPTSDPSPATEQFAPTALPSTGVRILAFAAILVAGACGGLIGYAFVQTQCEDDCTTAAGATALVTAIVFAVGVGIVAVLAMRAMAEWRVIQHRSDRDRQG